MPGIRELLTYLELAYLFHFTISQLVRQRKDIDNFMTEMINEFNQSLKWIIIVFFPT